MDIKEKNKNLMSQHMCIEPAIGEKLIYKYPNHLSGKDKKRFESHLKICRKCQEECMLEKFTLEQFKQYAPDIIPNKVFESVRSLIQKEKYNEVVNKFIRIFGLDVFKKVVLFPFSFLQPQKPKEVLEWVTEVLNRLSAAPKKPALVYEAPAPLDEKGGVFTSAILYLINTLANVEVPDEKRKKIAEKIISILKEENKKFKHSLD